MNRLPTVRPAAATLLLALAAMACQSPALAQPRTDANRGLDGPGRPEARVEAPPSPPPRAVAPQPRPEAQPPRADAPRPEQRRGDEHRADERRGGGERRVEDRRADGPRGDDGRRDERRNDDRRGDDGRRDGRRGDDRRADGPRPITAPGFDGGRRWPEPVHGPDAHRWHDGRHGLHREYPRPGWVVHQPPPRAGLVHWRGVHYRFWDGVWYSPGPRGYVVVRPPYGVVIADRPLSYSLLSIGGTGYLYANGVYYREYPGGGYEVVPSPVDDDGSSTALTVTTTPADVARPYVYPARGQSAERQASDEYECHAWAVSQTGFDPTDVATGRRISTDPAQRDNYQRARIACLEGRGYTVR